MTVWLAVLFSPILLWVALNAIQIEPGFPTDCGIPAIKRKFKEEAESIKVLATPNSWPWHVGLWADEFGEYPYCGGTLITDTIVVTAAHCIDALLSCLQLPPQGTPFSIPDTPGQRLHVLVGAHDYVKADPTTQLHMVARAVIHPQFNKTHLFYNTDIAVIKLNEGIHTVPKICFPDRSVKAVRGSLCYYAGWGGVYRTRSPTKMSFPKKLREAQVELTSDEACLEAFDEFNADRRACIESDGRTPCNGDSGGGLFCPSLDDDSFYWYGVIVSSSKDCRSKVATVSKVSAIHQWVVEAAQTLGL